MKPTYNVLMMLNKTQWSDAEYQAILSKVRMFYFPKADIRFYSTNTSVENVQWYKTPVTSTEATEAYMIDRNFYDKNFTKPALKWGWDKQIGIDIMCVVLRGSDVHDGVIQGACDWAGSQNGMVETWVKGDVHDKYYLPNGVGEIPALECNLMHELSHAIAFYNGVADMTHPLQDRVNGNKPKPEILNHIYITPKYLVNQGGYRSLRNFFRRVWGLF